MFTVTVETSFTASHQLALENGRKEPLHPHNWLVGVGISSNRLNSMGLVMDFGRLRAMVDSIVGVFDGGCLEKNDYFRSNGSSAEIIAKYIYEKLEAKLPKSIQLDSVRVAEGPGCSVKFAK